MALRAAAASRCRKAPPWAALRPLMPAAFSAAVALSQWAGDLLRRMDQQTAWEDFYAAKEKGGISPAHFEWFFGFEDISDFLLSILRGLGSRQVRILDVGCGTSALGLELYRKVPQQLHVSCLDFSPLAIELLQRLVRESPPPGHPRSEIDCHVGDATNLAGTFAAASFHLVLDKGTCDSLLRCPQGTGRARTLVAECLRVLKPEGSLVQFSDEDPDARVPFLDQAAGGNVAVREIGNIRGISYYAYLLGHKPLASLRTSSMAGE